MQKGVIVKNLLAIKCLCFHKKTLHARFLCRKHAWHASWKDFSIHRLLCHMIHSYAYENLYRDKFCADFNLLTRKLSSFHHVEIEIEKALLVKSCQARNSETVKLVSKVYCDSTKEVKVKCVRVQRSLLPFLRTSREFKI